MANWEEVKRLAADFQRVQLSSTKQKLSERNVIEIVSKLVELKLVEVVYTVDGKEYLTPHELDKEIREELVVHGGRINLVELAQILNVDFSHIESKVNEIKNDKNLTFVLGQLIDRNYLDRLAEEVNDDLQEKGHVTIPELTKQYDLPADFLYENLMARLGTIVKGQVDNYDKNVIFTPAFVARMRAQIRGAFSAVTRPIQVGSVLNLYKFHERLFFTILEDLVNKKQIAGTLVGGKQDKATYVPDIYTKCQNEWVDSFYRQNGYLEYDALLRLGISDPKAFIKKRYKSEPLVYLSTCVAGSGLQDQIEASVDEALTSGSWVNIMPLLPSVFSEGDANYLLTSCLKKHPGAILCCDTIVASDKLISECAKPFPDLMAKKAEKDAKSPAALKILKSGHDDDDGRGQGSSGSGSTKEDRKEQRRKKAATGSGSIKSIVGGQGREVKTKSLKKKGHRGREADDSDDEVMAKPSSRSTEIPFMSLEEIEGVLRQDRSLEECPDELITEIAQQLIRPLTKQYQEVAKSIFLQTSGASTSLERKKTHTQLQDKLTGLWANARLFEKGLKLFPDDTQANLVRHLLRTVCTDMTNLVLNTIATENMLSVSDESQLTTESRAKIISQLPGAVQGMMSKLNDSLNGKLLDDFFNQLDQLCGPSHLGVMLKKPDKKKERQLTFSHRQLLCDQIKDETDPAMTLHLAVVILFHKFTQNIISIPGRCVPQVIVFLKDHIDADRIKELMALQVDILLHKESAIPSDLPLLNRYQLLLQQLKEGKFASLGELRDLVIGQLHKQQSGGGDGVDMDLVPIMEENISKVKEMALATKKSGQAAAAED